MSDLYVDLKRRIPVVAEWTDVGEEEMKRAQARLGLSDEKLARLIPISAKTWARWKSRGKIPTHLLPKVAPILGFQMVPLEPIEVGVAPQPLIVTADLRESSQSWSRSLDVTPRLRSARRLRSVVSSSPFTRSAKRLGERVGLRLGLPDMRRPTFAVDRSHGAPFPLDPPLTGPRMLFDSKEGV